MRIQCSELQFLASWTSESGLLVMTRHVEIFPRQYFSLNEKVVIQDRGRGGQQKILFIQFVAHGEALNQERLVRRDCGLCLFRKRLFPRVHAQLNRGSELETRRLLRHLLALRRFKFRRDHAAPRPLCNRKRFGRDAMLSAKNPKRSRIHSLLGRIFFLFLGPCRRTHNLQQANHRSQQQQYANGFHSETPLPGTSFSAVMISSATIPTSFPDV